MQPPEPEDSEPVVRATHVEAPALDASERYPDLFEDEPSDDEPRGRRWRRRPRARTRTSSSAGAAAAGAAGAAAPTTEADEEVALTPRGNKRSPVTEADDVVYKLPKPTFLTRSNGAQKQDTKGIERAGQQLVEALSHFNVDARVVGTVSGPARDALRAAAGARGSRCRRSPSSRTTSPTRSPPSTCASWRRSPASRPSGSRCPTACARWSTSATSSRPRRRSGRR